MQLNAKKLSLAATATMGITYIICALFTAVFPAFALKFLGWMMHLVNVEKFAGDVQITFGGFVLGLLPILFYTFIFTYILAALYNRFTKA